MKKLFLTACMAVLGAFSLNAQGLAFRAEVGGNFTNLSIKNIEKKYDMRAGLRAGLGVEYAFSPMMYASTGLNYRMSGAKNEIVKSESRGSLTSIMTNTSKVRFHNLSLPINLGLRVSLSNVLAVSVEAGPYLSYALSGKGFREMKVELQGAVNTVTKEDFTDDLFKGDAPLKRFEAGVGASVAAEYSNYYLRLGTTWGLTNISKKDSDATKNNEFYLSVGLRF